SAFVTFSPRLSRLTLMPSALVSRVAFKASSIVVPATNRPETRCPIEELSAMCRKERFSERAMKAALSIGLLKVGFSCVWANSWFYHKVFAAVIVRATFRSQEKAPLSGGADEKNTSLTCHRPAQRMSLEPSSAAVWVARRLLQEPSRSQLK